jgi:hypothetical protein
MLIEGYSEKMQDIGYTPHTVSQARDAIHAAKRYSVRTLPGRIKAAFPIFMSGK